MKGDDASLVGHALARLLTELGASASVALEEHSASGSDDEPPLGPVLDALFTPPFLAQRRVVVLRDAEKMTAEQGALLASRLEEPFEPNVLVLVAIGKSLPSKVTKAVKAHGHEIDATPGASLSARGHFVDDQLRASPVRFSGAARSRLIDNLGEELSRLAPLTEVLAAAYGHGHVVELVELEPYLGESGGVPPWELTDAIDSGSLESAIGTARRMLGAGGRHPLQVTATLNRHFGAMLRLDGSDARDQAGAASLVSMAPYPAGKVLERSRVLGHDKIREAIRLLAEADLDLRGRVDWPGDLVVELLVARLTRLSPDRHRTGAGRTPGTGGARTSGSQTRASR